MEREGLKGVTLRAIAKEAGAPLAAVHYCFTGKDELMNVAFTRWMREPLDTLTAVAGSGGGLRAVVKKMADQWWRDMERNPLGVLAQYEVFVWALRNTEHQALARSIYPMLIKAHASQFTSELESAGEESKIPPDLLARAFVAIIDAASLQYLADPSSPKTRDLFDLLIDSLLLASDVND
jgi:AcrR family transcriptional regulator